MYSEKPDYNRHIVKQYLDENEFEYKKYHDIKLNDLYHWIVLLDSAGTKFDKEIYIETEVYEYSEGFGYGDTFVKLIPYFEREENDKEYNDRIKEEEEEYNKYLQAKKLEEEEHEIYLKDLEEYKRIKDKYGLI